MHKTQLPRATWRKSSHSSTQEGACVELAGLAPKTVSVRDSKDPHGGVLQFDAVAFAELADQIRAGAFDL